MTFTISPFAVWFVLGYLAGIVTAIVALWGLYRLALKTSKKKTQ